MQFSDQFTLLATPAHLSLVKILLIVMFLLHLPYIGMFIGGSFFSVIFNLSGKKNRNKLLLPGNVGQRPYKALASYWEPYLCLSLR